MPSLRLPAGSFTDNIERHLRTTESDGSHTLHVNVDRLPEINLQQVDGANPTIGSTGDAPISSDSPGTVSGRLRGLVKILASVWDAFHGRLRVDASGVTVPVAVLSQPLPPGAATEEALSQLVAKLASGDDGIKVSIESVPPGVKYALASLARPIYVDQGNGRINVNTITSLSQPYGLGGYNPRETLLYSTDRAAWAQAIRSRIS